MAKQNSDQKSIEDIFQRMDSIVSKLESGETVLEESLSLFEEGITLAESCRTQLNHAEQKVKELMKTNSENLENES
jgi:exodeoxyribonuclease VII small subunit